MSVADSSGNPYLRLSFMAERAPFASTPEQLSKLLADFHEGKVPQWLEVMGIAIDASRNLNGWRVLPSSLDSIAQKLKGKSYRKDHGDKIADIIGSVTDSWHDKNQVLYKARVFDRDVIARMLAGLVKYDSIQIMSNKIYCDNCYTTAGEKLEEAERGANIDLPCVRCGKYEFIVGEPMEIPELSAVATPAYPSAELTPLSFVASLLLPDGIVQPLKYRYISSRNSNNNDNYYETLSSKTEDVRADVANSSENTVNMSISTKAAKGVDTTSTEVLDVGLAGKNLSYDKIMNALSSLGDKLDLSSAQVEKLEEEMSKKFEEVSKRLKREEEARKEAYEEMKHKEEEEEARKEEEAHRQVRGREYNKPIQVHKKEDEEEAGKKHEASARPQIVYLPAESILQLDKGLTQFKREDEEEERRKREERSKKLSEVKKRIEERRAKLAQEAAAKPQIPTVEGKAVAYSESEKPNVTSPTAIQVPLWMADILKASREADKHGSTFNG